MNDRIKQVRKALKLSQEEFASRLGITGSTVSNLESGRRSITQQMAVSLCREFNINSEWLRTGQGDMFVQSSSISLDDYAIDNGISELEIDIIKCYMGMDAQIRDTLIDSFKETVLKHLSQQDLLRMVKPVDQEGDSIVIAAMGEGLKEVDLERAKRELYSED